MRKTVGSEGRSVKGPDAIQGEGAGHPLLNRLLLRP